MSDLIDRQAAIDALRVAYWDDNIQSAKDDPCIVDAMTDWAIRQVKALPPAQPKKRRWISADAMFHGVPFYCSECGENTRDTVMGKPRWKFCPMCGAKMEGIEDE